MNRTTPNADRRASVRCAPVLLALALCGCEGLAEMANPRVQQSATIAGVSAVTEIVAPDTVDRDAPFDVRFTSFENGCTHLVRDEFSVRSDSIVIQSIVATANQCGDALQLLPHLLHVRVSAPGAYRIYLRGRKETPAYLSDTVVTRALIVR